MQTKGVEGRRISASRRDFLAYQTCLLYTSDAADE